MISGLIYLVVYIIVVALILWLLNYLVDAVPMQPPFKQVAKIAILVIGVLIIILLLLNFVGVMDVGAPRLR
jgi:hypothetical protein